MNPDPPDRQRLREEELLRAEIRKEIAQAEPPPGAVSRISEFFESKIGFWLLTTVFAGLAASIYSVSSDWLHRDKIAEEQIAARGRQDFETILKIVPMLTSNDTSQRQIGFALLNGLASTKSIRPETSAQITATLQSIATAGVDPNASPDARDRAAEVVKFVEAARPAAVAASTAAPSPAPLVAQAVAAVQLPPRVYIQVGSEAQRPVGQQATAALQAAGMLVPGIQKVRRVPDKSELRYCDQPAFDAAGAAAVAALVPVLKEVKPVHLPASLCGNVRPNHFELWIADPGPG